MRPPTRLQAFARDYTLGAIAGWEHGGLDVRLPDGSRVSLGARRGTRPLVTVHDWAFFPRFLFDADLGAGESYLRNDWDTSDLVGLVRLVLAAPPSPAGSALAWLSAGRHGPWRVRRWGAGAASRNVRAHYDLGNEFFARFLDASMTYSAALYDVGDETLEVAQERKLEAICRRLRLTPAMHLLDVGCGWGSLALHAAHRYGCRVTGVTLSPAQAEWAAVRAHEAGMADRVEITLGDWRDVGGVFDAVASVEMLEAVGHRAYGAFFRRCDRWLAPGGRLFLQMIAFPGPDYRRYRFQFDFLRRHVFPGGVLPSAPAVVRAAARTSSLRLRSMEDITSNYVRTLAEWRRRLDRSMAAEGGGVPSRLLRTWEFYLALCEAGFASEHLSSLQMVFARPADAGLW